MAKVAWKTINGFGPYAYLQESVWLGEGKVLTKHIAYLGKWGAFAEDFGSVAVIPGAFLKHAAEKVEVPQIPDEVKKTLNPKPLAKLEAKITNLGASLKVLDAVAGDQELTKGEVQDAIASAAALPKPPKPKTVKKVAAAAGPPTTNITPFLAPTAIPKVEFVPTDVKGKPLVLAFNVTKLEDAAAIGLEELEMVGGDLEAKMLASAKKVAIENMVAELKAKLGAAPVLESMPESELSDTIEDVAKGKATLPKQTVVTGKVALAQEQALVAGKKDWDKDLAKISGQKGSNEGGLYKDEQTQAFAYVKWPAEARAKIEVLAGHLYQAAGVPVPWLTLIKFGGVPAVKSDWIDDAQPMTAAAMSKHKDVRRNFVVDAWLANWDVVGQASDNIVVGPGGVAYRIDVGGSLIYRAQGKPKDYTTAVPEIESMRSAATAPKASQVFTNLTSAELRAGAAAVGNVTDQQIDQLVDLVELPKIVPGFAPDLSGHLKERLKARRDFIIANVLNAKLPEPTSTKELAKIVDLSPKSLQQILENADNLKMGSGSKKSLVHNGILDRELGKAKAVGPKAAVRSSFSEWKGNTINDRSNVLRWASGEIRGRGEEAEQIMRKFWAFTTKPGPNQTVSSTFTKIEQGFESTRTSIGADLVTGLGVTTKMNTALLNVQLDNLKDPKADKPVTVYRSWRPDQVNFLKWTGAQVGDSVKLPEEPFIASWTLSPNIFNSVAHGGIRLKAQVPANSVLLTDRLNNTGHVIDSEDEILFCCPGGVVGEVVSAA